MPDKTIFAVSSGQPPSGICIIRLSGSRAGDAIKGVTSLDVLVPRRMVRCQICMPGKEGESIDSALGVWFPGPHSFTGEDCAELHVHGGPAVVAATLRALGKLPGLRLAVPGEFSRRAFEGGKLDLSSAEGLADLIAAETEAQRVQALRQLEGGLGSLCLNWQDRLKTALANMEATIDFSDEELPDVLDGLARDELRNVRQEIVKHLSDGFRGERIREGLYIVIVGPPNSGKSSLLNCLARREAAIVSEVAGTTRDIIEIHLNLGGYPVTIADTAGLRKSENSIETEGVRRALQRVEQSDIRLVVFDGITWPQTDDIASDLLGENTIGLVNKTDAMPTHEHGFKLKDAHLIGISAKTGYGLDLMMDRLICIIQKKYPMSETAVITRARHREAMSACKDHISRALTANGAEFWAEDLRLAMRELGRIIGQVGVEDVLDTIFSEFCIGK